VNCMRRKKYEVRKGKEEKLVDESRSKEKDIK
jgi:hypothetical protein